MAPSGSSSSHQADANESTNSTAPPSTSHPTSRHVCHCGKAFIRKEHLRRHQATHGERSFICHICQRSFTRNDLLRRHLMRHELNLAPEARRGRACDACHANKTKCNGGPRCTLCSKRNIECTFSKANGSLAPASYVASSTETSTADLQNASTLLQSDSDGREDTPETPGGSQEEGVSFGSPVSNVSQPDNTPNTPSSVMNKLINQVSSRNTAVGASKVLNETDRAWYLANSKTYFERFHETWPIIHAPTFFEVPHSIAIEASVAMILLWLQNPSELQNQALRLHGALMDRFFDELSRSIPPNDKPWPLDLFQAMLLNIIFAFYQGSEPLIARVMVLRGMLISSLREMEFFVNERASNQQKTFFPGTFIPFVQTHRESWKRFVTNLYRIDTYLSITRESAPGMHREELDTSLTSTFGLWNSWGLDVFFKRLPLEPSDRTSFKVSEIASDPLSLASPLLLIEDIHLGICGMHPDIWNYTQITRRTRNLSSAEEETFATLSWRLEAWKGELERLSHTCNQQYMEERTEEFPFMAYFGREEPDLVHWKMTAMSHIKGLVSNSLMLYHLQALRLYSDIRAIHTIATYGKEADPNEALPPNIQNHQASIQAWSSTPSSRKALIHAILALRGREMEIEGKNMRIGYTDPITYVTVATSALVLWAWANHSDLTCMCVPGPAHMDIGLDPLDIQSASRLEEWIQSGNTMALHGIAVCKCLAEGWMIRFAAALPQGEQKWELGERIAPVLRTSKVM